MNDQIQHRRGTAAAWTSAAPTLHAGEIGYETDTGLVKIGDGSTAWASLPYFYPGNSAGNYQTLLSVTATQTAAVANGTYPLAFQRGANITTSGAAVVGIYAADYASVGSLAPKLRIRGQVITNNTAPAASFRFALFPITGSAGAAANITYTLGTEVSGSTTGTATTPAATSQTPVSGSDFSLPSDGLYLLCVVQSGGNTAAASFTGLSAQLQLHYA